jgi:CRP-like cAMP-binding protein
VTGQYGSPESKEHASCCHIKRRNRAIHLTSTPCFATTRYSGDWNQSLSINLILPFVKKNIARGTAIFAVCDAAASVFAVCAGTVKISTSTADGRDVVFNLVNAGEIFGEIAVLDGGTRTADATAMTDCELVEIQGRDFFTIARKRPELGLKLLELLCRRLRRTSEQLEDMMGLGLPRRLAKTLLRLTEGIAPSVHGRKVAFTQREIGPDGGRFPGEHQQIPARLATARLGAP